MKINVFETAAGAYGYEIIDTGGSTVVYQEFDPDLTGSELMTMDTATAKAAIVLERIAQAD